MGSLLQLAKSGTRPSQNSAGKVYLRERQRDLAQMNLCSPR
jgi:hypothetical protein